VGLRASVKPHRPPHSLTPTHILASTTHTIAHAVVHMMWRTQVLAGFIKLKIGDRCLLSYGMKRCAYLVQTTDVKPNQTKMNDLV
jgi:hypothetical protein